MIDGDAYWEALLAQIRSDRVDARRFRLSLLLRRALAVLGRQSASRRTLSVQLHVINGSLERLRLADAEIRARLPSPHRALFAPRR